MSTKRPAPAGTTAERAAIVPHPGDGPVSAQTVQIAGFNILECADLTEALEVACENPGRASASGTAAHRTLRAQARLAGTFARPPAASDETGGTRPPMSFAMSAAGWGRASQKPCAALAPRLRTYSS